ncbi:TonB family protein [Lysobacter sp.]|uniref:TonB family protein n=1 Tax=Lysobacter sp. TaxID=72226 RepID=UPI002D73B7F9|nr:TonB family protein [Lysobacter sp.]HZX78184.1 TonB family protein [Lysobacter sp.]
MNRPPSEPRSGFLRRHGGTVVVIAVVLAALGALVWYLLADTASTRRPAAEIPMVMLPPPPPPPPPPEPEKTPEPEEPEEVVQEPEPMEPLKPTEAPALDTSDPVTMDAEGQAGNDSFGIQSGSGGGMSGVGAGGGNASYGRYLGYVLQQAIARDEKARRLAFRLQVDIWLSPGGDIDRVELVRGSGNDEADQAVLAALRAVGRIDERPPGSLTFPARVLIQGRRPSG